MSVSPHPLFYDGGAPRFELANDVDFPVGTTATGIVGDTALLFNKQADGLWKGGNLDDEETTIATNEIPGQTMAVVNVAGHSDVFSLMRYGFDGGLWKLLNAELLDGTTKIVILQQDEYKPEQRPPFLVVNYHATLLVDILANAEAVVRDPNSAAFSVKDIKNEKRSIQYRFPDCPLPPTQHRIRTEKRCIPKTRSELAVIIAKDLRDKLPLDGVVLSPFEQPVAFEEMVLLAAVFSGPGTIQPYVGVIRPKLDEGSA
ncbi:hypothetical protein GY45DRAFT_622069 [Cubamyces sp. BRFM 1775]|nr:hypothetical protein GY45DRAFT_622069 [Cubamyces sp. BRFM 1775]